MTLSWINAFFYNLHWLQRYLSYHEHALIIGQDHDALLLILIMGGFKCCCCYKLIKEVSTNTEYLMKIIIFCFKERNVSFINIDEYPLELIPLDSDILSLEMDSSFKVSIKYMYHCSVLFLSLCQKLQVAFWISVSIKIVTCRGISTLKRLDCFFLGGGGGGR